MSDRSRVNFADLSFRIFAALFVVLFIGVCVPLFLTPLPPLIDYPNHLARMHVIASLGRMPLLRQYYAVVWRAVPDLAMDILVPPLMHAVSLEAAGKLFLAAVYFLQTGGVAVLHRVLYRRWSAWSLLAFLVVYNRLLLWGFLNFLFAIGLAFWAFAGWIAWRERCIWFRLAFGTAAALTIYFAHLMAFGIYGAMVLAYEGGYAWRQYGIRNEAIRALLIGFLPLLPCLALFAAIFVPPHIATSGALGIHFGQPLRKFDLLFSVFDLYNRLFDVMCFALVVIGAGIAYWRRWFRLAPEIRAPLIFLTLLYVVMPTALFGATGVDRRMPLAMAMLMIGGSVWQGPVPRLGRALLPAALIMFVIRLGMVAASWHASGRIYAGLLTGLDALPPGARVAVAFPAEEVNVEATPLLHFPALAVARRDAFVPTLFANPTQQPIAFRGKYAALANQLSANVLWRFYVANGSPLTPTVSRALAQCDYIMFAGKYPFKLRVRSELTAIFVSPRFKIYRLPNTVP